MELNTPGTEAHDRPPSLQLPSLSPWKQCGGDLWQGFSRWQLWWLLGMNDIRQRYRRSRLGQFWITISMGIFVISVGPIYSSLFTIDLPRFLPHFTTSLVVWAFIASMLNDSCLIFVHSEAYLRQERIPKTVFILQLIVRNLFILAHNAILIPVVWVIFGIPVTPTVLLVVPGLILVVTNCFLAAIFLSIVCTRFRDLPQIVNNIVQVAFFTSPILWQRTALPEHLQFVVDYNPFAGHLGIVAGPLLGEVPTVGQYVMVLGSTLVLALLALPFFARFRARVVYWL